MLDEAAIKRICEKLVEFEARLTKIVEKNGSRLDPETRARPDVELFGASEYARGCLDTMKDFREMLEPPAPAPVEDVRRYDCPQCDKVRAYLDAALGVQS